MLWTTVIENTWVSYIEVTCYTPPPSSSWPVYIRQVNKLWIQIQEKDGEKVHKVHKVQPIFIRIKGQSWPRMMERDLTCKEHQKTFSLNPVLHVDWTSSYCVNGYWIFLLSLYQSFHYCCCKSTALSQIIQTKAIHHHCMIYKRSGVIADFHQSQEINPREPKSQEFLLPEIP